MTTTRWHLVLPLKEAALGKSRLTLPPGLSRTEVARAVARDTLEAVCGTLPPHRVTVVTSDRHARRLAEAAGVAVVPDPGAGLDEAIRAGWARTPDAAVDGQTDDPAGGVDGWAALLGDLPALRPEELAQALATCAAYPAAVVPDADGTGTVLLTSTTGVPEPRFGPGSAARHARTATLLELDLPGLRRDVDTVADLRAAVALGVGPHTRAVLATGGWLADA